VHLRECQRSLPGREPLQGEKKAPLAISVGSERLGNLLSETGEKLCGTGDDEGGPRPMLSLYFNTTKPTLRLTLRPFWVELSAIGALSP